MSAYKVPENACPACGHRLDGAMAHPSVEDVPPTPGDLSVCIACGSILRFLDDMALAEVSVFELRLYDGEVQRDILQAQDLVRERIDKIVVEVGA